MGLAVTSHSDGTLCTATFDNVTTSGGGAPDTTPPTPNPLTWATVPYATGSTSISMTATTASDPSGVEYLFDCTAGAGGHDSAWQDSATYQDTGLTPSTQYTYRVQARDKSTNHNAGGWSASLSATTSAAPDTTPPTPNPLTWATVPYATGSTSISMTATTASDPSGVEYFFDCTAGAGGHDSAWQTSPTYQDTGLTPSTQYSYRIQARDQSTNHNTGGWSTTQSATTNAAGTSHDIFVSGAYANGWSGLGTTSFQSQTVINASTTGTWVWKSISNSAGKNLLTNPTWQYDIYCDSAGVGDSIEWHIVSPTGQEWNSAYQLRDPAVIDGVPSTLPYTLTTNAWHTVAFDLSTKGWWAADGDTIQYVKWQFPEQGTYYLRNVKFVGTGGGDGTAPTPNPLTWATVPYSTGTSSISMTATTASDPSGVEYFFDCTAGAGGHDSAWQDSATYQDTGLSAATQYTYRVQARDKSTNHNTGGWSTSQSATTDAAPDTTPPTPNPSTWATVPYATGSTSISMTATTASDPSGVQYFFDCTAGAGGHDSAWQSSATYQDTGLTPSTQYTYRVQTRDQSANQNTGAWSTTQSATTQAGGGSTVLTDGFETNFDKWTDGGATDWDRATDQKVSGTYSAHAGSADNDLISDNLNTAGYGSMTIDFWYRDDDIDDDDNIYLQLYNGSAYVDRYELGNSAEDTWHHATITLNNSGGDAAYFISNFRVKFEGTSIDSGENLWVDDVIVTAQGTGGGSTPVGWWKLNETSGTAAADDGTGNNDGTVSGATWAAGHLNNALSFDGADDVVDILTETDIVNLPTADFSVAFWMNWNRNDTENFDTILGKYGHNGTTAAGWEIYLDQASTRLNFSILFATTDMLYRSSNSSIPANSWVHVACVYTASTKTAKIYVGGTEPGYATQTAGVGTYDTDSTIRTQLGRSYWSANYYRGLLDDVRFYDYALSGAEVATLAAQ
jgi:16S rRNA C1402 N4-methylase RsmH